MKKIKIKVDACYLDVFREVLIKAYTLAGMRGKEIDKLCALMVKEYVYINALKFMNYYACKTRITFSLLSSQATALLHVLSTCKYDNISGANAIIYNIIETLDKALNYERKLN
jgi:hypothetical protein